MAMVLRTLCLVVVLGVFGAANAWAAQSISLSMTVGDASHFEDPQTLPTATTYAATHGETITIGYEVTNTGDVALTRHSLSDSVEGVLLNDFPFTLAPGASAFILEEATVTANTQFTGHWEAGVTGSRITSEASDSVQVTIKIPGIALEMTVGDASHFEDPQVRPTATTYTASFGETVTLGYQVTNTSDVAVTRHDLEDSVEGILLANFPFTLAPGADAFLLEQATITANTVFHATWTARITSGEQSTNATDSITVLLEHDGTHTVDQDGNGAIGLSELLRCIQFYNSAGYSCATVPGGTEDGFQPGPGSHACPPHDADYAPQNWAIALSELLRVIQFYNTGAYHHCPTDDPPTEDYFCPGV
jgi:hypothetical protein